MSKILLCVTFILMVSTGSAFCDTVLLDGESVNTGSDLETSPLQTLFGSVQFTGNVAPQYDDDLPTGNTFSTDNGLFDGTTGNMIPVAAFDFGFDIQEIEFIFGGNNGTFSISALDSQGLVLDSFFQSSTAAGQSIGPVSLFGADIRRVEFEDTSLALVNIDNVLLTVAVPEPSSLLLFSTTAVVSLMTRRRRTFCSRLR